MADANEQGYYEELARTIQRGVFDNDLQSGKSFGTLLHENEQANADDRYIYMDQDQQQKLDRAELSEPQYQRATELKRGRNDFYKYPAENEMDIDDDLRNGIVRVSE